MNTYSRHMRRLRGESLRTAWNVAVSAYRDYALARSLYRAGVLCERTVQHWHVPYVRAARVWAREARAQGLSLATPAATARGA